jgi:uncharacterized protein DUF4255
MLLGVSKTLERYLHDSSPELPANWLDLANLQADDMTEVEPGHVTLFLYAIGENRHLHNQPLERLADGSFRQAPLALTLSYLLAYNGANAEKGQEHLAVVLRAFHSRPRLGPAELHESLHGKVEGLTVRLRAVTTEELNQIWTALNVGMRPALFYDVDVAVIEPLGTVPTTAPVRVKRTAYAQGVA